MLWILKRIIIKQKFRVDKQRCTIYRFYKRKGEGFSVLFGVQTFDYVA